MIEFKTTKRTIEEFPLENGDIKKEVKQISFDVLEDGVKILGVVISPYNLSINTFSEKILEVEKLESQIKKILSNETQL